MRTTQSVIPARTPQKQSRNRRGNDRTNTILMRCIHWVQRQNSLLALCVQLLALSSTFIIAKLIATFSMHSLPMIVVFILYSALAVLFSNLTRAKPWWHVIHGAFPLCVGLMLLVNIASSTYFILFLLAAGIFWTTYHTQVPFYPSKKSLYPLLQQVMPKDRSFTMIDIGSGLGDVSLALAKSHPQSHFFGIEIAPLPWLYSKLNQCVQRLDNVSFRLGDYYSLNFSQYDIVFAYLSPAATSHLWLKAKQEMRVGSLLISHEFAIVNVTPSQVIQNPANGERTYLYRVHYA